ncbi:MAG: hypothetical protein IPH07_34505 [Deltaproteobacteria bacterium]|nr:hypothetical protein [Deltaproteobacteria bacterium]MBK8716388.1 hypothetical protein [Deltaproteobacteria bacterium]MBP7287890.1 hypothetical protein [Nannocystaceae bacterium]
MPDEQFRVVTSAGRAAAEASLSTRAWVPLDEVPGLAIETEGLVVPAGGRVYLVRGVMLEGTDGTGRFSIEQADDGTTAVNWGCLGAGAARQVRRPLIVALPRAPRDLVVAVSMAR